MLERCRRGDPAAFAELYRQHAGRLYNLAWRMVGADEAEDMLQEIFLTAHRKLAGFRGDSALGTWLYRLAMNQCLDHLRSRDARRKDVTSSLDERDGYERVLPPSWNGDTTPGRLDLERAISLLPSGCRAAFVLHDVEGFEHREIGELLGIAEGTSKSQVHKARMRIRSYLGERIGPAI